MKLLFISMILLCASFSRAEDKAPIYKNWKTFHSDYGYEFKYPDCWSIKPASYDEPTPISSASKEIEASEGDSCKRAAFDPPNKNGVSFDGGWNKVKSKAASEKEIESIAMHADNNILRDEWKIYKRLKIDGGDGFILVENLPKVTYTKIRWEMDLYCSSYLIRIVGPMIKDPDKSYLDKFKAGDLALPEPEKTIYESIKCVDPKKPEKPAKKKK